MEFEEKLVRYIASKLLQRKFLCNNGYFPPEKKIAALVTFALKELEAKYKKLKYIRLHSENGLITPQIAEIVEKIKC